jgi:hypothetical protein
LQFISSFPLPPIVALPCSSQALAFQLLLGLVSGSRIR